MQPDHTHVLAWAVRQGITRAQAFGLAEQDAAAAWAAAEDDKLYSMDMDDLVWQTEQEAWKAADRQMMLVLSNMGQMTPREVEEYAPMLCRAVVGAYLDQVADRRPILK